MIVNFKYYMHDDASTYERIDYIKQQAQEQIQQPLFDEIDWDDLAQKMGRPFYEITLNCTLDTETGEVVIVNAGP